MAKRVDWNARAQVFVDMAERYRALGESHAHHVTTCLKEAQRLKAKAA